MDSGLITLLLAVSIGGAAYFAVSYVMTKVAYKKVSQSKIKMAYLAIEEAERSKEKGLYEQIVDRLRIAGWSGGLAPIVTAVGCLYAVCVLAMYIVGANQVVGVVLGIPVCTGVVILIVLRVSLRRQLAFQRQLMPALSMLAAQIETGTGAERALEQILPSLEDPLGDELHAALAATVTVELVEALEDVGRRYPSRAFSLFLAALEVDRLQGGSLGPALREASSMLQRQFELMQEAQAEISQAKMEFYGVLGIVAFIALPLLSSPDPSMRAAYYSPTGLGMLMVAGLLAGTGVWRASRIFRLARRGTV